MEILWPSIAFGLIVITFFLFSVLDGFDLGLGMIIVFVKDPKEAGKIVNLIAPFWDGNEVWLIIGVGLIFAFFPAAFAVVLSTFYLPFMMLIVAFIVRAVAIELSYHDLKRTRQWFALLSAGSFFATFIGLGAIGLTLSGLPLDGQWIASSRFDDYLSWFPLLMGLAGMALIVWHGLAYALLRERFPSLEKAAARLWIVIWLLSVIAIVYWAARIHVGHPLPAVIGAAFYFIGLIIGRVLLSKGPWAYRASCLSIAGAWISIGSSLLPAIVPVKNHPEWSLLLPKIAAPLSSLRPLVIIAIIMIPVILIYSRFIYCIFRKPSGSLGERRD